MIHHIERLVPESVTCNHVRDKEVIMVRRDGFGFIILIVLVRLHLCEELGGECDFFFVERSSIFSDDERL